MNPVASRLGADVIDRIADPGSAALHQRIGLDDPQAHHVDQRIAGVAVLERNLAADRRDADAVAVAGDAGNDAFHDAARSRTGRAVERSEAQRVEERDRPCPHGEDVADDAADAGRRALIGLDERGVVVRFDLEDRGQAVADIHRAGVLAGPLQHARAARRQLLQMNARALVAAVLGPHHREDSELGDRRLAPERADDPRVLVAGQTVAFQGSGIEAHREAVPTAPAGTQRANDRLEQHEPVAAAEDGLTGPLGVRHHADDVAALAADAGDVAGRAVRIRRAGRRAARGIDIPEDHAPLPFQPIEQIVGREVVALAVIDGDAQHLALPAGAGERRVGLLDPDADVLADELQAAVAQHRAGEQARFEQDLEAVADAEHRTTGIGEGLHRIHHRREPRDGAGAQVVTVRETTRQDDHVGAAERRVLVPHELGVLPEHVFRRVVCVVIAVGSGENDDGEFHVSGQ